MALQNKLMIAPLIGFLISCAAGPATGTGDDGMGSSSSDGTGSDSTGPIDGTGGTGSGGGPITAPVFPTAHPRIYLTPNRARLSAALSAGTAAATRFKTEVDQWVGGADIWGF